MYTSRNKKNEPISMGKVAIAFLILISILIIISMVIDNSNKDKENDDSQTQNQSENILSGNSQLGDQNSTPTNTQPDSQNSTPTDHQSTDEVNTPPPTIPDEAPDGSPPTATIDLDEATPTNNDESTEATPTVTPPPRPTTPTPTTPTNPPNDPTPDNTSDLPLYEDIKIESAEALNANLADSFIINDADIYRKILEDYFLANDNLPSSIQTVQQLVEQFKQNPNGGSIFKFNTLTSFNNQLNSETAHYSPQDVNTLISIPKNSLLIIAQAKCNLKNDQRGIAVDRYVVRNITQVNKWSDPVDAISSQTVIPAFRGNIAMIFRLNLEGADYTYCLHDYSYNYNGLDV